MRSFRQVLVCCIVLCSLLEACILHLIYALLIQHVVIMARFNITLPDPLKERLQAEAEQSNTTSSTLIVRYIKEHYSSTASAEYEEQVRAIQQECTALKADYEKQLEALQHKHTELEHQAETEVDALATQLQQEAEKAVQSAALQEARIKELQDELQLVKTSMKSLDQEIADKDDKLQLLEQEKQAILTQTEEELAAKDEQIQKLEEGIPELLKRLEEQRSSKETEITGLQHELERSQDRIKVLEGQVVDLKGQILDLKEDKQSLQKQLELVTLRLPAPKEGFFARIFGRRKKEREAQT